MIDSSNEGGVVGDDLGFDSAPVTDIIIVGAGSSGWMSAAYLARALSAKTRITVIESPSIPRIGVGEATLPTIKENFFDVLEIPEEQWMPACHATFKMGIRFVNWKHSPSEGGDCYYHCFGEFPTVEEVPLSHVWHLRHRNGDPTPMEYACYVAPHLCDSCLAPCDTEGRKAEHYAYHIDAKRLADFLRDWSVQRGVSHVSDTVLGVQLDDAGNIAELVGDSGQVYRGDIFIDCTGFDGLLIEKALHESAISFADSLLTDRALAINIPGHPIEDEIRPYTTATALRAGWMWETPLLGRTGNGYVFSSHFVTADEAEKELRTFFGTRADAWSVSQIGFQAGRRRRSWVKNCVAIGLSSSFLEPLESTGLYFIYAALNQLVQHFPAKAIHPVLRNRFNEKISFMVEDVRDFIVIHFCTTQRSDTDFWRANREEIHLPDTVQEILDLQKAGVPIKKSYHGHDSLYSTFEASFDRFWTNSNYQSVLCGVNYLPSQQLPLLRHRHALMEKAETVFREIRARKEQMLRVLPSHHQYVHRLHNPDQNTTVPQRSPHILI